MCKHPSGRFGAILHYDIHTYTCTSKWIELSVVQTQTSLPKQNYAMNMYVYIWASMFALLALLEFVL